MPRTVSIRAAPSGPSLRRRNVTNASTVFGVTATPSGQAWSISWSLERAWPGWRSRHSRRANSRCVRSIGWPATVTEPARLVEDDRAVGQVGAVRARGRLRSPAQRAQARRELLVGKRLRQVVVGAGVQPGDPVVQRIAGGEHDDRRRAAASPEPPGDLEPVDVGQADIEDDRIEGRAAVGDVEAVLTGRRELHDVTVLAKQPAQEATQPRIVLHDKEVHGLFIAAVSEGSLRI